MENLERHFVLVHGLCHGAWCWYKLSAMLQSLGHKVTAVDLAASGINPKSAHEILNITDYSEPLMKLMESLPSHERVILVGHSMGGITVTMAMERFPRKVAVAVFIAASMPGPDLPHHYITHQKTRSVNDFLDTQFIFDKGPEKPPSAMLFGPKYAATRMYQHSPAEALILATSLMRLAPLFIESESLKGSELTRENYGSVSRVFIICGEDTTVYASFQRWMVEKNPPDEVKEIAEADHMPMFSKLEELCSYLKEVAEKYY